MNIVVRTVDDIDFDARRLLIQACSENGRWSAAPVTWVKCEEGQRVQTAVTAHSGSMMDFAVATKEHQAELKAKDAEIARLEDERKRLLAMVEHLVKPERGY